MAVGKITKEAVDRLAPAAKEHCLWDTQLKGFGVKVTPNGSKSYLVQYRPGGAGTPTRRVTIGKHGSPWAPAQARLEAEKIIGSVRAGKDPQEERRARKREIVDLQFDKYADLFIRKYGEKNWSAVTLRDNKRYLTDPRSPAKDVLGRKALPHIVRADIAATFDAIPDGKPGYERNLYAVLRRLFAWAVERGDIDRSPMEGFKGPKPVASRDRVLSDEELKHVWEAAGELGYPFGPLYRLLMLTGQRRDEVASIDWRRLNRQGREWTLTSEETKNDLPHVVPLNELAIAELDGIAGGDKWPASGLVFTTTGKTAVGGFSKGKSRLDAKLAKLANKDAGELEPWRIHDLRRTYATGMQRLGVRFEVTEALLNHVSGSRSGVAGIYQRHDWANEKRLASNAWNERIVGIVANGDVTDNILAFPARS